MNSMLSADVWFRIETEIFWSDLLAVRTACRGGLFVFHQEWMVGWWLFSRCVKVELIVALFGISSDTCRQVTTFVH